MKGENFNFPVTLIWKALEVLENQGYEEFRKYAVKVNMPTPDIERVLDTYKYRTDPEYKKEIDQKRKIIKDKMGVNV